MVKPNSLVIQCIKTKEHTGQLNYHNGDSPENNSSRRMSTRGCNHLLWNKVVNKLLKAPNNQGYFIQCRRYSHSKQGDISKKDIKPRAATIGKSKPLENLLYKKKKSRGHNTP